MVKQRMSSVDVAGEVASLRQRVLGLRLANVYDLNPKTYLLKLSKSGEDGEKVLLLLESGTRFHTTEVIRDKSDVPSNFTLKLRKHIRTRRLEDIRQLGVDRIVDFVFGSGEAAYHLILEMYAQGNIILTDHRYEVLTLLRSHRDDDAQLAIMARHPYPMHSVRLRQPVGLQDITAPLQGPDPPNNLKGLINAVLPFGPAIAEHVVLDAGLLPTTALPAGSDLPQEQVLALHQAVQRLEAWFAGLETAEPQGFITLATPGARGNRRQQQQQQQQQQPAQAAEAAPPAQEGVAGVEAAPGEADGGVFQDYMPLKLLQNGTQKTLEFPSFDAALDHFFSKIEGQRADMAKADAEKAAMGKLDRIRADQSERVQVLQREAEEADEKALLIEYNLDVVDGAINAVNEALASGMDWVDLEVMIREERRAGNPIAAVIHSLQLAQNRATLLLQNCLDDADEDAMSRPATKVSVDLALTAHANASAFFDVRKRHEAKQAKTLAANEQSLKAAEKKALAQLQQVRNTVNVATLRKPLWFERFNWFISSENYLILSGRDAQQNDLLVKRYFKRGDIYVHAELHGASSTIIKNPDPDKAVPPLTLQQAGLACVCRSRAWDSKIMTSAWWVHHHQVSKTAPTGEYLVTGSFMVRGKKNFLPPQPLVFGFGFMFKLEPSCIAAHAGERAVRGMGDEDGTEAADGDVAADMLEEEDGSEDVTREPSMSMSVAGSTASALEAFLEGSADAAVARNYQRYGLPQATAATTSAAVEEDTIVGAGPRGPAKRHVPAAERKGKGGPTAGKGGQKAVGAANEATGAPAGGQPAAAAAGAGVGGKQAPRGKAGQQKKAKSKYADQDEEQRQLAMAVLGSTGQAKSRSQRRQERKSKREEKRKGGATQLAGLDPEGQQEAIQRATGKQWDKKQEPAVDAPEGDSTGSSSESDDEAVQDGGTEAPAGEGEASTAGQQAGEEDVQGTVGASTETQEGAAGGDGNGEVQRDRGDGDTGTSAAAGKGGAGGAGGQGEGSDDDEGDDPQPDPAATEAERAEIAALLAEEGQGPEPTDEDRERLTVLDSLTGVPRPEDVLLFAVPVCAPYNTMQNFKYKVKLVPGTLRKGKAGKQATELLVRSPDVLPREKDLMKAVPEMDTINAILGNVKINMPGMAKIKQDNKKAKKAAHKNK